MKVPTQIFLDGIQPKKVYYFGSTKLNTGVPHYFICVSRLDGGMLILVCCTSQFEKRKNYIEKANLPFSTLVWINPDTENGLEIDSYVDCNSYFDYSIEEFKNFYENDKLEFKGEISDTHFEQILIGLKASPIVEENIKEILPNSA
ncbi:MAG: hypothetical protein HUU01_08345 [Saprospiraceae bacterium]|nr:hypothetical protein [Saprospiraceae bacterium]